MALPTRTLEVTYGSFTFGKGTSYIINVADAAAPVRFGIDPDGKFRFSCALEIGAASISAFQTLRANVEAAFAPTNRNGKLVIKHDTTTLESFDPASSTGFNAKPSWQKIGSEADTATSCRYLVSVELDPPTAEQGAVKVTYGTFDIGAGTSYRIDVQDRARPLQFGTSGSRFRLACAVIIDAQASVAAFQTLRAAFEAAFSDSNRNKKLLLKHGSTTLETFDPDAAVNTGYLARPSWRKPGGSPFDSDVGCRYELEVELETPALNGRRDVTWELSLSDSLIPQFSMRGVYTATGTSTAYENYLVGIDALAALLQTALGGSWDGPLDVRVDGDVEADPAASNKISKVLRFSRRYIKVIYRHSLASLADSRLKNPQLRVALLSEAPGDFAPGGADVVRMQRVSVTFASAVDSTQSNLLQSIYDTVVRPLMLNEAATATGSRASRLVREEPELDRHANRISARMELLVAGSGRFLESSVRTRDELDPGSEVVPAHTGQPLSGYPARGPGSYFRTVEHRYRVLGASVGSEAGLGGGGGGGPPVNRPAEWKALLDASAEADFDEFFGLGAGTPDDEFATSGDVPEPGGGLIRVPVAPWSLQVVPRFDGISGRLRDTEIIKSKRWRYYRPVPLGQTTGSSGDIQTRTATGVG